MYVHRSYQVTRQERECFKLSGDKLAEQLRDRKSEPLTKQALDLHWATAVKKELSTIQ